MYIRLINSTLRENEYLFRLNDQQKKRKKKGGEKAKSKSQDRCVTFKANFTRHPIGQDLLQVPAHAQRLGFLN